ncbi:MAG: hypothetical protein PHU34_07825 [Candidatus Methanoperedens sp.]|nr:hypothetical protein [Candidatus Methanoperedens sp.]
MKNKDNISIIAGSLVTFFLWVIITTSLIEPANFLAGFPCSAVGGYVAGRLKASAIPSGAASGLVAAIILTLYMSVSYGDWTRSVMFGVIMAIIWIIGGVLGDLVAIMGKNKIKNLEINT